MAHGQKNTSTTTLATPSLQLLTAAANRPEPINSQRLWLAIALPHLALDARSRAQTQPPPLLLCTTAANRRVVHDAADSLRQQGIQPGQSLSHALALMDQASQQACQIRGYDGQREHRELAALGQWALRYTAQIVLTEPRGLLLEIGGSLKLFGGHEKLRASIAHDLKVLGLRANIAIAPTPLAADWLARLGHQNTVLNPANLHTTLAALPMRIAVDAERDYQRLHGLGMRCIGDLLRLPRAGLNRRLSRELGLRLDRAFGQLADPRQTIRPQAHFDADILLPDDISNATLLSLAGDRLLQQLQSFLRGCQRSAQRLIWQLHHHHKPPTLLITGTDTPSTDPARWLALLDERLAQTQLSAPVYLLQLKVERLLSPNISSASLFADPNGLDSDASATLLERLRVRLGARAVGSLRNTASHNPDNNWRYSHPHAEQQAQPQTAARPLWLFNQARPLTSQQQQPTLRGPLRLSQPAERIESDWWTSQPISRDYFTAKDQRGRKLWIYQDRKTGNWFWHGLF